VSIKESLQQAKKPLKPKLEQWMDTLDKDDREALEAAAVDPELSTLAITTIVRESGYRVNKDTISAWRRARGYSR
jgi:hypothetical protein